MLNGVLTVHVPKKGDAYLAGTVHVAKEVQTIQRYQLEPYMSEKRVKPESATVHVAKCFPHPTEVGRAFLIHFQKVFLKKVFLMIKIARELKFYT